jgi:hypothetical protein
LDVEEDAAAGSSGLGLRGLGLGAFSFSFSSAMIPRSRFSGMDRSFPSGTLPPPLVDDFFEAAEDDLARRGAPETDLAPDALFVLVAVDDFDDDDDLPPRADDVSFVSDIVADLFDERLVPSIVAPRASTRRLGLGLRRRRIRLIDRADAAIRARRSPRFASLAGFESLEVISKRPRAGVCARARATRDDDCARGPRVGGTLYTLSVSLTERLKNKKRGALEVFRWKV